MKKCRLKTENKKPKPIPMLQPTQKVNWSITHYSSNCEELSKVEYVPSYVLDLSNICI